MEIVASWWRFSMDCMFWNFQESRTPEMAALPLAAGKGAQQDAGGTLPYSIGERRSFQDDRTRFDRDPGDFLDAGGSAPYNRPHSPEVGDRRGLPAAV
ncbi:MAG: hypothetical protein D6795_16215 [Deltaproteobacteria bacterium]|nr:MAG: hypothetical protein D6795_16215 [Deltaproteobacteria bacterium]